MIRDITQVLRSGHVRRWHQNPDMAACGENNAEHQWNVAAILLYIEPNATREQLIAALFHDVGELKVGDKPWTMKHEFPHLAKHHAEVEASERSKMVQCEAWDDPVVNAADKLAALIRMHHEGVGGDLKEHWWGAMRLLPSAPPPNISDVSVRCVRLGERLGIL